MPCSDGIEQKFVAERQRGEDVTCGAHSGLFDVWSGHTWYVLRGGLALLCARNQYSTSDPSCLELLSVSERGTRSDLYTGGRRGLSHSLGTQTTRCVFCNVEICASDLILEILASFNITDTKAVFAKQAVC